MFRNSTAYLGRYFAQTDALAAALAENGHELRLILAEGDSIDSTWLSLLSYAETRFPNVSVIKREHGGPSFGSVNVEQRWRQISFVMDGVLAEINRGDDAFIWVESDLVWATDAMLQLLKDLESVPCATGFSFTGGTKLHYDTWGHRAIDGSYFSGYPPYHPYLRPDGLTEILSAGSVIACRGAAARDSHCDPATEGPVGWCKEMRSRGFKLWFDPTVYVEHP